MNHLLQPKKYKSLMADCLFRSVCARNLYCFWAVRKMGETMAGWARNLGLSIPFISKSVVRGQLIAESRGFQLIESWLA